MDADPAARWFAVEMASLRLAHVAAPRPLAELRREADPQAATRAGAPHVFDPEVLARLDEKASPLARLRVRLPVTFYVDTDADADAYLTDGAMLEILAALGEVPRDAALREGRYWMAHVLARRLAERYPTAFQFVLQ